MWPFGSNASISLLRGAGLWFAASFRWVQSVPICLLDAYVFKGIATMSVMELIVVLVMKPRKSMGVMTT